jgi:hypothetical protein
MEMIQMIKLWGKIITENRIENQFVTLSEDENIEYQQQLKECIAMLCYHFDIEKPYWLKKNLKEYNKIKKTSFTQDNFIEEIYFDRLEIEVLEEK